MRLYTFTNYYLNTISQGIQPLHVLGRMFAKYRGLSQPGAVLYDWEANHTTAISCSAGDYQGVLDCAQAIERFANTLELPWATFHEDQRSLGGLMTSCGIVVPAHIYEASALLRSDPKLQATATQEATKFLNPIEFEFANWLTQFSLAR